MAHLCIAPACGKNCDQCREAISPLQAAQYAVRYAYLLRNDPRFGMPVEWMRHATLDEAIEAEFAKAQPVTTQPKGEA